MRREMYYTAQNSRVSVPCRKVWDDEDKITKITVFTHGFSSSKTGRSADAFRDYAFPSYRDFLYVSFDWPGHGGAKKTPLRLGACTEFFDAVLEDLDREYPGIPVYVYGTSFGGYLPLKYIYEHGMRFEKCAVRCPAVNMYEILCGTLMKPEDFATSGKDGILLAGLDEKVEMPKEFLQDLKEFDLTVKDLRPYSGNILIMQGTADELVSYEKVKKFAADNGIRFSEYPGADHRYLDGEDMKKAVFETAEYFGLAKR